MWLDIFGMKPESSSPPAAARQTVITLQHPIVVRGPISALGITGTISFLL
jgi:hypothetical protein